MILRVYLGLGSNIGDLDKNLREAVVRLRSILREIDVSPFVETAALDRDGRPDASISPYLNAVVAGQSVLTPRELFRDILAIERDMGRDPQEKSLYLPRVIDIDILYLAGDRGPIVIRESDLIVPHPRLAQRPFFTEPLRRWGVDYEMRQAAP